VPVLRAGAVNQQAAQAAQQAGGAAADEARTGGMQNMRVLLLGWGVQSFTMAAMSALGELPPVDVALHADTTHESSLTYRFAESWTQWLLDHGVKVVTVNPTHNDPFDNGYGAQDVPFYTLDRMGNQGQGRRQCTTQWKILPMRRWLQANRNGEPVEQWIGISTDEAMRMKPSDVKYITNRWPLIEMKMSRKDCETYLSTNGLEVPARSSCVFCPFHDTSEWRKIQAEPTDWDKAVAVDERARNLRPPYRLFVHPSRKPLELVDLRTAEQKGQYRLLDDECTGICGV
jgi:hypothetical protein